MASPTPTTDLEDVKDLAHKLYRQCGDSPSSFKLLTPSVRKLRNVLEETADVFDESRTLGPSDLRLLTQVSRSREILTGLDAALQAYQKSRRNSVDESAVADVKTNLDVSTHELSRALEAMSTGEIELRLDMKLGSPTGLGPKSPSSQWYSTTASTAESVHKSSRTSSPSRASGDAKVEADEKASEEKEALENSTAGSQGSNMNSSMEEPEVFLDWRSPFASPDPLSISIEQASSMILGSSVATLSPTRPRQVPTSSVIHRASTPEVKQQQDPELKSGDALADEMPKAGKANGLGIEGATSIPSIPSPAPLTAIGGDDHQSASATASVEATSPAESKSHENNTLSTRKGSVNQPSPKLAGIAPEHTAFPTASSRPESESLQSREEVTTPPTLTDALNAEESTSQGAAHPAFVAVADGALSSPKAESSPSEDPCAAKSLTEPLVVKDDWPSEDQIIDKPLPPPPPESVKQPPDTTPAPTSRALSPSMPRRQPPAPPKPRRSVRGSTLSTYRVVNAEPDESSSEDDMYTSSRPTSPTDKSTPNLKPLSPPPVIPRVSIDRSAIDDEGNTRPESSIQQHHRTRSASSPERNLANSAYRPYHPKDGVQRTLLVAESAFAPTTAPDSSQSLPITTSASEVAPPPLPPRPRSFASSSSLTQQHQGQALGRSLSAANLPPPVPRRPSPRSLNNSTSSSPRPGSMPAFQREMAPVPEKELTPESGLEVNSSQRVGRPDSRVPRSSVDVALNVTATTVNDHVRSRSVSASGIRASQPAEGRSSTTIIDYGLHGWYAPSEDDSDQVDEIDKERIQHIVHHWNAAAWDQVEPYLTAYLESLVEHNDLARARRVRHLLGVCASFKGLWESAITLFLSVLRTPITDLTQLDDGDCAAAYWLGDSYAMLNQRDKSRLAYCMAERCSLFHDPAQTALSELIELEQEAVHLALPRSQHNWLESIIGSMTSSGESLLDSTVISPSVAKILLMYEPRRARRPSMNNYYDEPFRLSPDKSRSASLYNLSRTPRIGVYYRMKLTADNFLPNTSWPMLYDPLFCMANVQSGRLLAYECDLLAVFRTNKDAKVPRASTLALNRVDCFSSSDLPWLIATLRDCLRMLSWEFAEVANVEGVWFVVRYSFIDHRIATTNYFSIALFRQAFRSGYGVDIAPDGIASARILRNDGTYDKGVHVNEPKRVKNLIREYLDTAAKDKPKTSKKKGASAAAAAGGESSASDLAWT